MDSVSPKLVADALVRKSSVKDANAEYVPKLRVDETATNEEIQAALHKLFNSGPQGIQDQSSPQGTISSMNDDVSPQGEETNKSIMAATVISKIQLDNALKNSLTSALRNETPYSEI